MTGLHRVQVVDPIKNVDNIICHFVRITLFIASTPLEAQLSMCSDIAYHDKMKTATANVRQITERECACLQERYGMSEVML